MKLLEFGGELFGQGISIFESSVAWYSEHLDPEVEHTIVERTMPARAGRWRREYTLMASRLVLPAEDLGGSA